MTDPQQTGPTLEVRVGDLLRRELQIPVRDEDTDLVAEGHLDSLTFIDLLYALEQAFGIRLPVEKIHYDDFRSVRTIVALVERERRGAG